MASARQARGLTFAALSVPNYRRYYGGQAISLVGISLPTFVIGILLILIFAVTLHWLPSFGRGETVLILGATGVSGLIAVTAAKRLGAGRVIAAGRNREALQRATRLGADATVDLAAATDVVAAYREQRKTGDGRCGQHRPREHPR